ncbi:S24 family peptidase [Sinorhizobium psoraleae]|uniref:S24 family peptidase n=1 Tax=Sinorhizobium psoraleae TaxID=520838 RepID=A0ABT4KBM4_9HYPH|nr:S24 family peptidase [Sinorhizobium psoraleae]MCZ4089359.1 S24 family peptidase [Sinorhizobium psoraleae]
MPEWMLSRMGVRAPHVAAFPSQGDSMTPTINDGDVVFVDTRHRVPSPPGIYALADEFGGVIVKRLEVTSRPGEETITVRISSDNPRHLDRELTLEEITIVGRYIGRFTI